VGVLDMASMIRLGIVDDHPVFRLGLMRSFEREPDLAVVWELGSTAELFATLHAKPVDVVLMDLYLGPDQDAFEAIRAIGERYPGVQVIVISASLDWEAAAGAREAGAAGYLLKDLSIPDMVAAIGHRSSRGSRVNGPQVTGPKRPQRPSHPLIRSFGPGANPAAPAQWTVRHADDPEVH